MYQLYKNSYGEIKSVIKYVDGQQPLGIPFDPANTDYQAYLEWVAEGNEPLQPDNNQ